MGRVDAVCNLCVNATHHTATGYTPFELMFGRLSTLPSALKKPPSPQYNHEDYVSELRERLQFVHQQARKRLLESKATSKEQHDRNVRLTKFQVGSKVVLFDETVRRGRSRKLSAQWIGPYTIAEMDGENATIVKGRKFIKVHVNRLKPFF